MEHVLFNLDLNISIYHHSKFFIRTPYSARSALVGEKGTVLVTVAQVAWTALIASSVHFHTWKPAVSTYPRQVVRVVRFAAACLDPVAA